MAKVLEPQLQDLSFQWAEFISFKMDNFVPLAVQGTLKRLLQHHNSKASILWRSPFFMVKKLRTCNFPFLLGELIKPKNTESFFTLLKFAIARETLRPLLL